MLENIHFAVNLFTALVFFGVFWLYYDAWLAKRENKVTVKLLGFFLLSVSFIVEAVVIETTIISAPLFFGISPALIAATVRVFAYSALIVGLLMDPIQEVPTDTRASGFVALGARAAVLPVLGPIGAAVVGFLYLKRATVGLEDHLKPLAWSFFILSLSELVGLLSLFQTSTNVRIFQFVAPFGPVWIASLVLLIASAVVLCKWVFGYLLKQFQAQLFMVYTTTILAIFLITTVSFTGLLLSNMEAESLRQIETDVKVLDFALGSQREQLVADAQSIAASQVLVAAIETNDRKSLGDIITNELLVKRFTHALIVSTSGQVLARGEDRDRVGDSVLQDSVVKRALLGESQTTIVSKDGVVAPDLTIQATAPIRGSDKAIIGVIVVGKGVDMAFVDGMKKTTGLDASVYGGSVVSATTFVSPDGITRVIGMKEEHASVTTQVLQKGELFAGTLPMRGMQYTSAFLPLKDVDNNPVGMLFVGRPQSAILQAAGSSIQYTFLITAVLLVCSVFPAYYISKYIADQL